MSDRPLRESQITRTERRQAPIEPGLAGDPFQGRPAVGLLVAERNQLSARAEGPRQLGMTTWYPRSAKSRPSIPNGRRPYGEAAG